MASPLSHTLPVGANKLNKNLEIIKRLTEHFIVSETHLKISNCGVHIGLKSL